jgi:hypothetical protein
MAGVLGFGVALALVIIFWYPVRYALGITTQASMSYDFVSGVGPMLTTVLLSGSIFAGLWHHISCHQQGCARIARYPIGDTGFKVCRIHHPDQKVRDGLKSHHLHAAWHSHQERTGQG